MSKNDQQNKDTSVDFPTAVGRKCRTVKTDIGHKKREKKTWAPPSDEQWQAAYDAADEIKRLKPWEKLWDTCLFELWLPDQKEPVYCSVMGRNGDCYGINIYPGYDSISGYYRLLKAYQREPFFISMSYQNCLICNFGSRNEISSKDYRIIKQLERKYRGNNQWTYFRSMRTGFYPWQPDHKEMELFIPALQHFIEAYKAFDKGTVDVDFDSGESLLRRYNKERDQWENVSFYNAPVIKSRMPLEITDELYIARLKKQKRTQIVLSLDIIFLPFSIQENSVEVPIYPRVLLLLDETNGKVLNQHILGIKEEESPLIRDTLSSYILKHGRPSCLRVRDDRVGCYVEDLCKKAGIDLIQNAGMPVMDDFAESLVDYMSDI